MLVLSKNQWTEFFPMLLKKVCFLKSNKSHVGFLPCSLWVYCYQFPCPKLLFDRPRSTNRSAKYYHKNALINEKSMFVCCSSFITFIIFIIVKYSLIWYIDWCLLMRRVCYERIFFSSIHAVSYTHLTLPTIYSV